MRNTVRTQGSKPLSKVFVTRTGESLPSLSLPITRSPIFISSIGFTDQSAMRTRVPSERQCLVFNAPWVILSANAEAAFVPRLYPIGGNPPVSRMPAHFEHTPSLHPHVTGDRTTISSCLLSLRRSESTFFVMTVPASYPPAGRAAGQASGRSAERRS